MRANEPFQVFACIRRDEDACHQRSKLIEWKPFPCSDLLGSPLGSLKGAGDPIKDFDDVLRVDIRFVDRLREKRASECPLLQMCPLSENREFLRVLGLETYVDACLRSDHGSSQDNTKRHESCKRSAGLRS